MTNEELKLALLNYLSTAVAEETGEWPVFNIEATDWLGLATHLKADPSLSFDFLFCVTCVDWKTHLSMVYHLQSTKYRHSIVVKAKLNSQNPTINSVAAVWRTAEFHEREAYEMFGVDFIDHPDLRLLILPDGWEGKNPMRKDFEDPVNMIRL